MARAERVRASSPIPKGCGWMRVGRFTWPMPAIIASCAWTTLRGLILLRWGRWGMGRGVQQSCGGDDGCGGKYLCGGYGERPGGGILRHAGNELGGVAVSAE